jgi:hypothetical protein
MGDRTFPGNAGRPRTMMAGVEQCPHLVEVVTRIEARSDLAVRVPVDGLTRSSSVGSCLCHFASATASEDAPGLPDGVA